LCTRFPRLVILKKSSSDVGRAQACHFVLNGMSLGPHFVGFEGCAEDVDNIESYDARPASAKHFIETIEEESGYKISDVSTGPGREALVSKA